MCVLVSLCVFVYVYVVCNFVLFRKECLLAALVIRVINYMRVLGVISCNAVIRVISGTRVSRRGGY